MTVDSLTGVFELQQAGFVIGPTLTRSAFLSSNAGKEARLVIENQPYFTYSVQVESTFGKLGMSLTFEKQRLDAFSIEKRDSTRSWANWSEEGELRQKAELDDLLVALLGRAPYSFAWGDVTSLFDSKSGAASIYIRYRQPK